MSNDVFAPEEYHYYEHLGNFRFDVYTLGIHEKILSHESTMHYSYRIQKEMVTKYLTCYQSPSWFDEMSEALAHARRKLSEHFKYDCVDICGDKPF
jgi:hypothetical protein